MVAIPKSVMTAAVWFIGLTVLSIIAADAALIATGNPTLPGSLETLASVGLGGLLGAVTLRTTPELPPGAQLTQGQTTISTPTTAENMGETPSGQPVVVATISAKSPAEEFATTFPPTTAPIVDYADSHPSVGMGQQGD